MENATFNRQTIDIEEFKKDDLASRDFIRTLKDLGITAGRQAYNILISQVRVRNKFNRDDYGDIGGLADGIISSGGTTPIFVDILKDGTVIITDGERRYLAYLEINRRGVMGFEKIPALVNDKDMTETQRLLLQFNANNVKNFTPLEQAKHFKELHDAPHNMSMGDIAKHTGWTKMSVSNSLKLVGISDEERDLINSGAVSATAVLGLMKSNVEPEERVRRIKQAAAKGDKLKVKDTVKKDDPNSAENVIKDLEESSKLEPNSSIENVLTELRASLAMIDKLTTDGNILDITFRMAQRIIDLRKAINEAGIDGTVKGSPIETETVEMVNGRDPLFVEAARLIVSQQNASPSLLQRKLKLGYNRANRIIDQLEVAAIIGPFKGSIPRKVFFTEDIILAQHLAMLTINDDDQPF